MTLTDIGILLIVLCIVLWAIMAALHRHTVQMEALKAQVQELLKAQQARAEDHAAEVAHPAEQRDNLDTLTTHSSGQRNNLEPLSPHAPASPTTLETRRTLSK